MRSAPWHLLSVLLLLPDIGSSQPDSTVFDDLLITALQGDMGRVLKVMDTLDDPRLRSSQVRMKKGFQQRFRSLDEDFDYRTSDTAVRAVMDMYHIYWRQALLDPAALARYDSTLAERVTDHLAAYVPELMKKERRWIHRRWNPLLKDHLKAHGVHSAIGRTGALYDLLLHTEETVVRYPITTPEDTFDVKVFFMESVLSHGWEGFATFDTYFPGGWATTDALYCVRSAYDTASEAFLVSYVKHEGQHFSDLNRFPKLDGTDLEYRAKLVELSSARESLFELISFFLRNSGTDPSHPHAFANHCLIRDLSRHFFQQERVEDMAKWKDVPIERIHKASTERLLAHTRALQAAGAKKVRTVIQ